MKNLRKNATDCIQRKKNVLVKNGKSLWNPYHKWATTIWVPAVVEVLYPFMEL